MATVAGTFITRPDIECGSVGSFQSESATKNATDTEKNENMERDHIPQSKYMVKKIQKTQAYKSIVKVKGKSPTQIRTCVDNAVVNRAPTIALPVDMHAAGRTGGSKGRDTWKGDMKSTPKQVADQDIKEYRRLLKGENLAPDEKEVMDKVSDDCKKDIEKGLQKMEKEKFNNFFKKVIDKCKQPVKTKRKRK
ncbi:MAG: hypothetical protein L3J51_01485 [Cocleimonas sp.]|nr:hypothetical protein [Cocleimonas sp.]